MSTTDAERKAAVDAAAVKRLAEEAARDLEEATAGEILKWAAATFPESFAVTSSMTDSVLVHLVAEHAPAVPILFLDTGYHFAETIETLEAVRARYPVEIGVVKPRASVREQDLVFGVRLHERDPDACCRMRKVDPLNEALEPFAAWASGLRRADSQKRRGTPVVEWDGARRMVKISPIARWTDDDVDAFIAEHHLPINPLLYEGYPSIGCEPCTSKVTAGADPRSGRWASLDKDECGIHHLLSPGEATA